MSTRHNDQHILKQLQLYFDCLDSQQLRLIQQSKQHLILGDSGTGKTSLAQLIHHLTQATGPFIPIHCPSIPDHLIESELFGYKKGAFTGADTTKVGRIEKAQHGTLFLDEVGDMSPAMQSKLLELLDTQTYYKIGDHTPIQLKTTIIAATNANLLEKIHTKDFRFDLYQRLANHIIELQPLYRQPKRLMRLIPTLLTQLTPPDTPIPEIAFKAREILMSYQWPGNIRELKAVLQRALLLQTQNRITEKSLIFYSEKSLHAHIHSDKSSLENYIQDQLTAKSPLNRMVQELITGAISQLLKQGLTKKEAAQYLQIGKTTLYKYLQQKIKAS